MPLAQLGIFRALGVLSKNTAPVPVQDASILALKLGNEVKNVWVLASKLTML